MARYSADAKDQVRDAVDMVDLVSSRTELRRAGANRFEGLCPFHEERTPSFGVDPVKKVYHCFGCGAGGDVFTFGQEIEGLDFVAALEYLADRFGIQLEREEEDPRAAERRLPPGEARGPKYLNTPEGELHHKGRQLFGLALARADAARIGEVVLVEGYTDVLALHQAGLRNTVGLMGTALTEEQVGELARLVGGSDAARVTLALDADASGQQAMVRAAALAARPEPDLRVAALPEGRG